MTTSIHKKRYAFSVSIEEACPTDDTIKVKVSMEAEEGVMSFSGVLKLVQLEDAKPR